MPEPDTSAADILPQPFAMMTLTDEEFGRIRDLVYAHFGIRLTPEKKCLVVGRLQKLLRQRGFESFGAYLDFLEQAPTPENLSELVNRISTNHTFFFREREHFDYLVHHALPAVMALLKPHNTRDLRVWCAACASGEEAYTLMMLIMDLLGAEYSAWNAGLLATDISEKALAVARAGTYPADRLQAVPAELRQRHFQRLPAGEWQVALRVRREIVFRRFNLMNAVFPFKKPFHVIFCRNVMIYFDAPTRDALARRLFQALAPGGYLFIGHSETLGRDKTPFEYLGPAMYRRPLAGG